MATPNGTADVVTRRGVCPHDCPDACGLLLSVDPVTQRLLAVRGDPEHPFTRGLVCGKVDHYEERVNAPDRVLYPLRRTGPKGEGRFTRISWDEALATLASRLAEVVRTYGGEAVLPYSYAGTMGEIQERAGYPLMRALGASELDRTVCDSAATAGWNAALPGVPGTDPERVRQSDCIVIWGMDAAYTNLHFFRMVRERQRQGARLIVVDPTRTHTAQVADLHLSVRPGTDVALVLGVLAELARRNALDRAVLAGDPEGWRRTEEELLPAWSADRAAAQTGLPRQAVDALVEALATSRAPFVRIGVGIGRHPNGAMTVRAIASLAAALGAFAKPGGGLLLFTEMPPLRREVLTRPDLLRRPPPRTINMIRLGEALTALDPPVRALVVYNSNPADIAPDQTRVRRGLAREDLFTVVLEHFVTDTARYADLVLPATMMTEHTDLYHAYGHTYLRLGPQATRPRGESRSNWWVFRTLARRMGLTDPLFDWSEEDLWPRLVVRQSDGDPRGLTDEAFAALAAGKAVPIGTVAGDPLAAAPGPAARGRLRWFVPAWERERGDGLLRYAPYVPLGKSTGQPGHDDTVACTGPGPWLHLLTAPGALYLNTTFQPVARLRRREGPPAVAVHPDDAAALQLTDGTWARAHNAFGESRFLVRVSDAVRPGTAVCRGVHDDRDHGGALGVNALTSDALADHGRGPVFYGHAIHLHATAGSAVRAPRPTDVEADGRSP